MSNFTVSRLLRVFQLMASGAVIGLYAAKAFGFVGFEVTPPYESYGAAAGAAAVGVLKLTHLV